MATSTEATAPAKKSNTMMYAAIAIIIIIVAGVAAYFAFFNQPTFTPNVTIHLNGNSATGWNATNPGPAITVHMTDKVRIVLLSADGGTHDFVIAYSGTAPSAVPASGDAVSSTFSSTSTSINYDFTPSKTGTFKYYCSYHYTVMVGTITIS